MRALLLLLMSPGLVLAQFNVQLTLGSNDFFTLTVGGEGSCDLSVALVGGKYFDWADAPHSPDTGSGNPTGNGGASSPTITFIELTAPRTVFGDIDGNGLTAVSMGCAGNDPIELNGSGNNWSGTIPVDPPMFGPVKVTWTHPTRYTDDSELLLSDIANTMVFWAREPIQLTSAPMERTAIVNAPASEVDLMLPTGDWYFAARTMDVHGAQSYMSAHAAATVLAKPNEPANLEAHIPDIPPVGTLTVGAANTIYGIQQTRNRVAMYPIGAVPVGTVCDPTHAILAPGRPVLYRVPREAAIWPGNVQPEIVYAQCSVD